MWKNQHCWLPGALHSAEDVVEGLKKKKRRRIPGVEDSRASWNCLTITCTVQYHTGVSSLPSHTWPGSPSFQQPLGSSQVVVLGEVGDEGDSHTHVYASSNGDG